MADCTSPRKIKRIKVDGDKKDSAKIYAFYRVIIHNSIVRLKNEKDKLNYSLWLTRLDDDTSKLKVRLIILLLISLKNHRSLYIFLKPPPSDFGELELENDENIETMEMVVSLQNKTNDLIANEDKSPTDNKHKRIVALATDMRSCVTTKTSPFLVQSFYVQSDFPIYTWYNPTGILTPETNINYNLWEKYLNRFRFNEHMSDENINKNTCESIWKVDQVPREITTKFSWHPHSLLTYSDKPKTTGGFLDIDLDISSQPCNQQHLDELAFGIVHTKSFPGYKMLNPRTYSTAIMPNPEFVFLMTGVKITYTKISNVSKTKTKEKNQLEDDDDQSSGTCPLDKIKKCNYPCCRRNAKKRKPEPTEYICPRKTNKPIKTTCQKSCKVDTCSTDSTTPKEMNRCRAGNNDAFDDLNKTYHGHERTKSCCKSKNKSLRNTSRRRSNEISHNNNQNDTNSRQTNNNNQSRLQNSCCKRSKPCSQSLNDTSNYDWTVSIKEAHQLYDSSDIDWTSSDENQKPTRSTSNNSCKIQMKQKNGQCPSDNGQNAQCSKQSCNFPTQNSKDNQPCLNNNSRRLQQEKPRSRRNSYRDTNLSYLDQIDRNFRNNECKRKTRSNSFPCDFRRTNQHPRNNNEGQCCKNQNNSCTKNLEYRRNQTSNRAINESAMPVVSNNSPDRAENSIISGPRYDENWNPSVNTYKDFMNYIDEDNSNVLTSETRPRNRNIMPLYNIPDLIEFSADTNNFPDLIEFSADNNNFPRDLLDNSIPRIQHNRSDWSNTIGFDNLSDDSWVYRCNEQYPVTSTRRNSRDQSNNHRTARSLTSRRNSYANTSESQRSTRSRRSANNSCNCQQNHSDSRNNRSRRGLDQARNTSNNNNIMINNNWENEQNPYNHPSMSHIEDVNMSPYTSFEDSINNDQSEYDLPNLRNASMPDLREPNPNSDVKIVLEDNIPDIRNTPMPPQFFNNILLLSDEESTEYPNCTIYPHIEDTPIPEEMLSFNSIGSEY